MKLAICAAALALAGVAAAAFAGPQDVAAGRARFMTACVVCHSTVAGENGAGPSLAGVAGRVSGTLPGYDYSPAMKAAKIRWDAKTLDRYLTDPGAAVPGTQMTYAGEPDPAKRAQIVAYLLSLR